MIPKNLQDSRSVRCDNRRTDLQSSSIGIDASSLNGDFQTFQSFKIVGANSAFLACMKKVFRSNTHAFPAGG